MARLKKLTIYVEAYAEMSRDAGSIPAASTISRLLFNANACAFDENIYQVFT